MPGLIVSTYNKLTNCHKSLIKRATICCVGITKECLNGTIFFDKLLKCTNVTGNSLSYVHQGKSVLLRILKAIFLILGIHVTIVDKNTHFEFTVIFRISC